MFVKYCWTRKKRVGSKNGIKYNCIIDRYTTLTLTILCDFLDYFSLSQEIVVYCSLLLIRRQKIRLSLE